MRSIDSCGTDLWGVRMATLKSLAGWARGGNGIITQIREEFWVPWADCRRVICSCDTWIISSGSSCRNFSPQIWWGFTLNSRNSRRGCGWRGGRRNQSARSTGQMYRLCTSHVTGSFLLDFRRNFRLHDCQICVEYLVSGKYWNCDPRKKEQVVSQVSRS